MYSTFLVLLSILFIVSGEFCDKKLFQRADKIKLEKKVENITELSAYKYIYDEDISEVKGLIVRNQNVNQLCIGSLPVKLELLLITFSNLKYIEPGSLINDDTKYVVDFSYNNLTDVKSGVFSGTNIISVNLTNNEISYIESSAFDDMPLIQVIVLNNNKLSSWNSNWFENCPKLHKLFFAQNLLHDLPEAAFQNLEGAPYLVVDLEGNLLEISSPKSFKGIRIFGKIILKNNQIKYVLEEWFRDYQYGFGIDFGYNKIDYLSDATLRSLGHFKFVDFNGNPLPNKVKIDMEAFMKRNWTSTVFLDENSEFGKE